MRFQQDPKSPHYIAVDTVDQLLAIDHITHFNSLSVFLDGANSKLLTADEAVGETLPAAVAPFWRNTIGAHGTSFRLMSEYANPNSNAYCQILLGMIDQITDDQRIELMARIPFSTGRYEPENPDAANDP